MYVAPFSIRPEDELVLLPPNRRLWRPVDLASDFRHTLDQNSHF